MLKMKKSVIAMVLLATIPLSGCFGQFNLVRTVYKLNQAPKDKFVRSLLTWVMVIVPVYSLAALGDFVILNVIEFWTGSNPINASRELDDGTKVVMRTIEKDGARVLEVTASKDGEILNRVVFDKLDQIALRASITDAEGAHLGTRAEAAFDLSAERQIELAMAH